jgi:hypothetical protein
MKPRLLTLVTLLFTSWATGLWATPALMEELPTSDKFRCLNCHTLQDPQLSEAELNPFGNAFKDNGSKWNEALARSGADGDNCTNGFELSDENGDGVLDVGRTEERSNPGDPGCALQLSETTWQNLKELFRK